MAIVLTNNAKFRPYTFDELLKPLAMATQEYNAIEEGIAELGSKANLMRMYANEEPDSEWSKKYNEYANDLDKQAESLAKYGLNPASRQGLLNLKRTYSSSVSPIEEAVKARKEAYKYRDSIRAKDNTAMFKNRTLSLSDFMNGKEGDNTYISGKDIMARVASKAQITGTKIFNSLMDRGYTSEQAMQQLWREARDPNNAMVQKEMKDLGIEDYSPEDQAAIMNAIDTGMYNAVSEIAKGEYMTKKEREALKLQRDNFAESKRQHNLAIQAKGYKIENGKIVVDEDSPYWTLNNIEWNNGKPISTKKDGSNGDSPDTNDGNEPTSPFFNNGVEKVIGREWGSVTEKGKEIKGIEYSISGTSDKAKTARASIINTLQAAYNNGTAIIIEDRGGFKIGAPKEDVPMNMWHDFGDIIKKDDAGNLNIDINKELKVIESTDTVSYGDNKYDLNKYILVLMPTSDNSTVYVGIPKGYTDEGL